MQLKPQDLSWRAQSFHKSGLMAAQEHATISQPGGPWGAEWASYHESKKKKPNWQQDDRPQLSLYVDDQSAKAQEVGKYV